VETMADFSAREIVKIGMTTVNPVCRTFAVITCAKEVVFLINQSINQAECFRVA